MFNLNEILSAFLVLFAVIDILGAIPIILDIKQKTGKLKPGMTSIVSLGIMILFLFVGESILGVLGVDLKSFSVAGSLIIAFIAFEMILGIRIFRDDDGEGGGSVVPLAFPIIAGAGTMTTLISIRAEYELLNVLAAILLNVLVVFLVLKTAGLLERMLGKGGVKVLKKVFGIILLSVAVKLFSSNVKLLFQG